MARTAPTSVQEAPGNFQTGALWNAQVKAMIDWGTAVPIFSGYATSAQSLADSTVTAISLDGEEYDLDAGHSTVTNTSRYTVAAAGKYLCIATLPFASNTSGIRSVGLQVNGAFIRGSAIQTPTLATTNTWVGQALSVAACNVNDYIEMYGWQTSGGALSTNPSVNKFGPTLQLFWIST